MRILISILEGLLLIVHENRLTLVGGDDFPI
jgi:hypothetical protein